MSYTYNTYTIDGTQATAEGMRAKLATDAYMKATQMTDSRDIVTAYYWRSNDRTVPSDYLYFAFEGQDDRDQIVADQERARKREIAQFVRAQREAARNETPEAKAERLYEMRAAFGPGTEVVNVITGEVEVV